MADNIAITAGSGTTVATDERTISSAVHVQRVSSEGGTTWNTGQVTPTASAATLLAAAATRYHVTLHNQTNMTVFIGVATVTNANFGMLAGASIDLYHTLLIQLIVDSTTGLTGKVHYSEESS